MSWPSPDFLLTLLTLLLSAPLCLFTVGLLSTYLISLLYYTIPLAFPSTSKQHQHLDYKARERAGAAAVESTTISTGCSSHHSSTDRRVPPSPFYTPWPCQWPAAATPDMQTGRQTVFLFLRDTAAASKHHEVQVKCSVAVATSTVSHSLTNYIANL